MLYLNVEFKKKQKHPRLWLQTESHSQIRRKCQTKTSQSTNTESKTGKPEGFVMFKDLVVEKVLKLYKTTQNRKITKLIYGEAGISNQPFDLN